MSHQFIPQHVNNRLPNFRGVFGTLVIERCFACAGWEEVGRPNLPAASALGYCAHCGWKEDTTPVYLVVNEFDQEKVLCEGCKEDMNQGIADDRERWRVSRELKLGFCEDCGRGRGVPLPTEARQEEELPVESVLLQEDEPCSHVGCLQHITHPCEGCGRTGGRTA